MGRLTLVRLERLYRRLLTRPTLRVQRTLSMLLAGSDARTLERYYEMAERVRREGDEPLVQTLPLGEP